MNYVISNKTKHLVGIKQSVVEKSNVNRSRNNCGRENYYIRNLFCILILEKVLNTISNNSIEQKTFYQK
jgi:hypothetical protein